MEKLVEYNLQKLKGEEIYNLKRPVTSNEIVSVIKKLRKTKSPGPDDVSADSTKHSEDTYFPQTLPKIEKNISQIFLWNEYYPNIKTWQTQYKKTTDQ